MDDKGSPEDVQFADRKGYLEARIGGDFQLERFKRQIEAVVKAAKDRGVDRLLIDVTRMSRFESMNTTDRFEIGAHGARLAGNVARLAMVGVAKQLDREEFGARVAQNRGLNVRLFLDEAAAAAWLTGPDEAPKG